jgi:hypothetical protein
MNMWRDRINGETGSALLIALLVAVLLAGVGAALITVTSTETLITGAHRYVQETVSAADAAFERALLDFDALPDWSVALLPAPANTQGTFVDGTAHPVAPNAQTLDLAALTLQRQAESDLTSGPGTFGADSPQWRLFAHAPFDAILPPGAPAPPSYLIVWVADDGWDGDGDPTKDSNGRLLLTAEAHGAGGTRRRIDGAIWRPADGVLRVLSRRGVP